MSGLSNPLGPSTGHHMSLDIPVGVIMEKSLSLKVSARGSQVVLGFFNKGAGRGFEVGFSERMVGELQELLKEAAQKLRGTSHGA